MIIEKQVDFMYGPRPELRGKASVKSSAQSVRRSSSGQFQQEQAGTDETTKSYNAALLGL